MSTNNSDSGLVFENSYAQRLDGYYVLHNGDLAPKPRLIKFNSKLAKSLGFDLQNLDQSQIAAMLSGGTHPRGAMPLAQAYAGHQFGGFSAQLGDGRAILLGEVIDCSATRVDLHLKGSGRTPFSRGGDGKATLGPVLREYLLGEAMHALQVPTTRGLSVVLTGEKVMRDRLLTGAVLGRVASSHIRVGTFQFMAARGEIDKVKLLADYAIERHFNALKDQPNCYLEFLKRVIDAQAQLVARWMSIGFVHGVMNTDNMTISGETIDYGPCAFQDSYNSAALYSSIDHRGRYAYNNQASAAKWNLARLAETLLGLIAEDQDQALELASAAINDFDSLYQNYWLHQMRSKLGLFSKAEKDLALISDLLKIMQEYQIDFTQCFRALSQVLRQTRAQGAKDSQYFAEFKGAWDAPVYQQWQQRWLTRLAADSQSIEQKANLMEGVNPLYIPRNHKVEEALQAAENDNDFAPFERLLDLLTTPYTLREGADEYAAPAPAAFGKYQTFCGT